MICKHDDKLGQIKKMDFEECHTETSSHNIMNLIKELALPHFARLLTIVTTSKILIQIVIPWDTCYHQCTYYY